MKVLVVFYRDTAALHKRYEEENIKNEKKIIKGLTFD
jgi:hypothetical protein